jgi:hypothetical protein
MVTRRHYGLTVLLQVVVSPRNHLESLRYAASVARRSMRRAAVLKWWDTWATKASISVIGPTIPLRANREDHFANV